QMLIAHLSGARCELRIIAYDRIDAGQNRIGSGAQAGHDLSARWTANPIGRSVDACDLAICRHRVLVRDEWAFRAQPFEIAFIEADSVVSILPDLDEDAGAFESADTLSVDPGAWIAHGDDGLRDSGIDQGVGAGRRPSPVRAWLQSDIKGCPARGCASLAQRHDFGVGLARLLGAAFTDDGAVANEYRADGWVWTAPAERLFRETKS